MDRSDPLLGPEAQAANPRALPWPAGPERVVREEADGGRPAAFAFDPARLDRALLGALRALPGARWSVHRPADALAEGRAGGEALLVCDLAVLEAEAARLPFARVLLAAHSALERQPAEPRVMGVLNVTPDSFSDGGRYLDPGAALERGLELEAEGAAWIDVGGESTRPGAPPVAAAEELSRVLPVLRALAPRLARARISIDTTKAEVARAALDLGAGMVNDVAAGRRDPGLLALVAERGCQYVAMHAQGDPERMQVDPRYGDPVADVARFLRERLVACWNAGIDPIRIVLDPGIGFGKRLAHNLALLRRLPELRSLGRPLLVGVSRKSFIAHIAGAEDQDDWRARSRADRPEERLGGTAAAVTAAVFGGAEILRVHDVRIMAEAIRVARALARPAFPSPCSTP